MSRLFLVPKSDGSFRPVLNVKRLNESVQKEKFKMDTIHHAKALVREGAYMFTVDLTDAFNGIPLHPKYYKYFRFRLGNQHYQFKVLFLYFFIHC